MNQPLAKLAAADLAELVARIQPEPPVQAALEGLTDVPAALLALERAGFLIQATKLVAHALPKREAVWWACMCADHTAPAAMPDADRIAREDAELWVRRQTDELRRSAMAHAQDAGLISPEAWAAVGAFWSGDSMSPLGQPLVPPAPYLAGTAVAGSVALASVRGDVLRQNARLAAFLASGREIAAGGQGRLGPEPA